MTTQNRQKSNSKKNEHQSEINKYFLVKQIIICVLTMLILESSHRLNYRVSFSCTLCWTCSSFVEFKSVNTVSLATPLKDALFFCYSIICLVQVCQQCQPGHIYEGRPLLQFFYHLFSSSLSTRPAWPHLWRTPSSSVLLSFV